MIRDLEFYKDGALGDQLYRSASGLYVPARGTPAAGKAVVVASDGIPEWTDIATQAELAAASVGGGGGGGGGSGGGSEIGSAVFNSGTGAITGLDVKGIVASVTRLATGKYQVAFTTAQPDAKYTAHMTASDDNGDPVFCYFSGLAADYNVNGFIFFVYGNGSPKDQEVVTVSIFRYAASGGSGSGSLPDMDLINFWPSSAVKATASSSLGSTPPIALFLRGTGDQHGWLTNATSTGWAKIEFPSAVTMKSYALMPWSVDTYPSRTGKTWTLEGSNDDATYVVLDTQTNFTAWNRYERIAFTTSNTTAYKFYKLNVTANQGDAYMGFGGLWLYGQPGAGGGSVPAWVANHPDNPPTSPDAMNDEFTGTSLDAKWTLVDLGSINASVTKTYNSAGVLSYSCPSSIQTRIYALTQPAPAGTWRIRSKLIFDSATWNYFGLYLIARRAAVSKSTVAGAIYHSSFGAISTHALHINEPSTLALDQDLYDIRSDAFYLELEYDGTNLIWRMSKTGVYYTRFWSETAASHLGAAPTTIGINWHFYGGSNDVNHIMTGSIDWFRRVA